jgi:hypothetical protein
MNSEIVSWFGKLVLPLLFGWLIFRRRDGTANQRDRRLVGLWFGLLFLWTLIQFFVMLREPRVDGLFRQFWSSPTAVGFSFLVLVASFLVYAARRSKAFSIMDRR